MDHNILQLMPAALLILVNAAAFLLFGADKWKARHSRWRIPESTLLLLAALGGSIGALLGMKIFHHKTRKPKFYLGIPAILILQVMIAGYLMYKR